MGFPRKGERRHVTNRVERRHGPDPHVAPVGRHNAGDGHDRAFHQHLDNRLEADGAAGADNEWPLAAGPHKGARKRPRIGSAAELLGEHGPANRFLPLHGASQLGRLQRLSPPAVIQIKHHDRVLFTELDLLPLMLDLAAAQVRVHIDGHFAGGHLAPHAADPHAIFAGKSRGADVGFARFVARLAVGRIRIA